MNQEPWQTNRARSLRRAMTPAEKILWAALRGRRFAGYKFRRQFPDGCYVLDFYCHLLKLALELDGETHLGKEEHDQRRQDIIEAAGVKVIRFWNNQVYDDLETVLDVVWAACQERMRAMTSIE